MTTKILLAVALLAACSGKKSEQSKEETSTADPPGSTGHALSAADEALAASWVTLYGDYATALEGAGVDCARAAAAAREVNAKNAELISRGKPRMAELRASPESAGWLDANIKPKLGAALDRMAPLLDSCRGNSEVSAALAAGAFEKKD